MGIGIEKAAGIAPAAPAIKTSLGWHQHQDDKKKSNTDKPGEFEAVLRKRMEGQK